jgi:small subunit ribosomal protein S18
MPYDRDNRFDDRDDRGDRGDDRGGFKKGGGFGRRRACRFCSDKELKIDYKQAEMLSVFVSERGKIVPRRISGNCAKHQRWVATAVKRARQLALLSSTTGMRSE